LLIALRAKVAAALARPGAKIAVAAAQGALLCAVVAYLFFRLSQVGWSEVWESLPTTPLFYLIFTIRYFALPLSEIPTYEIVWRRRLWRHASAFLRKRVYNFAVMGYSGEAFFTLWARRTLDLTDRDIVIGVKDNNILSALVSNLATAAAVACIFATGAFRDELASLPGSTAIFGFAFASASILGVAVLFLRQRIVGVSDGAMARIAAINVVRIAVVLLLQALLYASALPGQPLGVWLVLITLQLVLTRIPFLPNPDIVFLTAALHLAGGYDAPEAAFAGMLVAEAGLSQIFNAALFAATTHLALDRPRKDKPPEAA
jgi:hypothetical protein